MYTRSKTLYLTSKIEKNIIQYIENSQIIDDLTFSRKIQNDLSDIITKNTRYNVQETIYSLEFLYNQYRIRREQNLDYSIVIPIKIVYNADVEWKNNICSICYDKLKRKNDTVGLVGNFSKINELIGWKPKKKFEEIFREMVQLEKFNLN